MTECTLVLDRLGNYLIEIHRQNVDYEEDQGMLEPFPYLPTIDHKHEAEEWATEYWDWITKAEEMESKLLHTLQTAQSVNLL